MNHVSDPGLLPASLPPRRSWADPSCGLCVTAGAYSQGAGENQLLSSFLVIWWNWTCWVISARRKRAELVAAQRRLHPGARNLGRN